MVIISSTIDDEQLWARFAVCQGRKTGLNDKYQPVPWCTPIGVSIPGKKSRREMEVASIGPVQKQRRMITYIFKKVINIFPYDRAAVQNLELSAKNNFTHSYKQVISKYAPRGFIILNISHMDSPPAVLEK
jgi:hypothetical protein